ncbi:MAG: hypothetical protein OEW39_08435, partial [Deltaproteobacteria bacterium]|nr:hypothetical protein [Deltaproteobacteria bacterium]
MGNLIIKQVQRAGLILLLVSGFHLVVWGVAKAQVPIRHVNLQQMMQYDLRALGMGGGFGPVARGEAALLYNPAGLAQQFRSIKLGFGLSVDIEEGDFYKDTTTISKGAPTQAKLTDYFTKYLNKSQNYRTEQYLNAVAMFGGPGFGVGAGKIKQDRYTFEFQDTVPNGALDVIPGSADSFFARQTRLSAMVYGLGFPAREGQILMGLTFKQMTYTEMSYSKPMDIMVTGGKISMPKDGWVYKAKGYDAGLLYRMESFSFMRPQWSMVFYNLGGVTLN